jgi:hypothetical protein
VRSQLRSIPHTLVLSLSNDSEAKALAASYGGQALLNKRNLSGNDSCNYELLRTRCGENSIDAASRRFEPNPEVAQAKESIAKVCLSLLPPLLLRLRDVIQS